MTAESTLASVEDPAEILRVLPLQWHEQFLGEYRSALDAAHEVRRFQELRDLLRLWRLRAVAYADPGFDSAARAAREGRAEEFVPADQVIPGWADRS